MVRGGQLLHAAPSSCSSGRDLPPVARHSGSASRVTCSRRTWASTISPTPDELADEVRDGGPRDSARVPSTSSTDAGPISSCGARCADQKPLTSSRQAAMVCPLRRIGADVDGRSLEQRLDRDRLIAIQPLEGRRREDRRPDDRAPGRLRASRTSDRPAAPPRAGRRSGRNRACVAGSRSTSNLRSLASAPRRAGNRAIDGSVLPVKSITVR